MERRKFMVGVGSTAIGASALVGSGAFSFMQTDRAVEMDVVSDDDAFLALAPGGENGDYAQINSGQIAFYYTDAAAVDGEGLNPQSVYLFDDVAEVTNQGSQEVTLSVPETGTNGFWSTNFVAYSQRDPSSSRRSVWPKDGDTSNFDDRLNDRTDVGSLSDLINTNPDDIVVGVGETVHLGMAFAAGDEGQSESTDITIRAEAN